MTAAAPAETPPRRITPVYLLYSRSIGKPEPSTEKLPAPPCPARGPEAGSHRTAALVGTNLNPGSHDPKKPQNPTGHAIPWRVPEAGS